MKEVSCRAVGVVFSAIARKGIPAAELLRGIPYDLRHLTDKRERIEWDVYCDVMANLSRVMEAKEIEHIGVAFIGSSWFRPVAALAGLLFTARDFYAWANTARTGGGNQLFSCVKGSSRDVGPNRIEITLEVPSGYRVCPEFFLISKGGLAAMPRVLGLGKAEVTMLVRDRCAIYDITYPPGGGSLGFVRKALVWPFRARAAAQELREAHEELLRQHQELDDYRKNLERMVAARTAELSAAREMLAERKAREMKSIFSSYVSPKVVDQITTDPDRAHVGGDYREVTVLFSDVRGYTAFAEKHTPREVVDTLNEYLAAMAEVIFDHDGTLDKFLGDGIMAYWGAPLPQCDHAERAVRCALAMRERMGRLQDRWRSRGSDELDIRVGISSGSVIAGNIGAEGTKMEYTVIGDTVNLASRLEGSAKLYGVTFVVAESTYDLTREAYLYRELDLVRLIGKDRPIRVFELLAARGSPGDSEMLRGLAAEFKRGLDLFRGGEWHQAHSVFAAIHHRWPADRVSELYLERCTAFLREPPPPDWDGAYRRTEK